MSEFAVPPSDEPFDFRHQAAVYARYRRDYSTGLYAAIEERTGPAAGRRAVDLGCGTGFVGATLARHGWRTVGIDFSAPMLAAGRAAGGPRAALVRARAEALPVAAGGAALVACGTAFHWLAPAPALAEVGRVLEPGGWVALFWRYPAAGEPTVALLSELCERLGRPTPAVPLHVHPEAPFAGAAGLEPMAPIVLPSDLEWTAEDFHGYVSTVEWLRRWMGPDHAAYLAALRSTLEARFPAGFRERNEEHLFLARRRRDA